MSGASVGIVLHDFALGGTERIALRLASAWVERGREVTIFCGSTNGPLGSLAGAAKVVAADPPIARRHGSRRRLVRAAAAWFGAHPVDACFIPGNFHWPVVPALAALPDPPVIVAQISAALDKPQRGRFRQWAFDMRMRRLLARADAVAALSDSAQTQANAILRRSVAITIPLPALADDVAAPTSIGGEAIVAAGRLVPEKGFMTLIEAFARLDRPDARLTIVGAGPDDARMRAGIVALGLADRVTLPGYVADVRPWLDDARLFVLSSQFEGFPAVLVEALAAGRPVVATACTPATRELLGDPAAGRVVPIDDADAMAHAIGEMLAAPPPDPAALAALVAGHRIGPVADAYLALFDRLTA